MSAGSAPESPVKVEATLEFVQEVAGVLGDLEQVLQELRLEEGKAAEHREQLAVLHRTLLASRAELAQARDIAAEARDAAADRRDRKAEARGDMPKAERAARKEAADDRAAAARDRHSAAEDRAASRRDSK